jgi:uncharacterized protein
MNFRGFPGLVVLAVLLMLVVPSSVAYYTDWLWFGEVGYQHIFLRTLRAQLMVFAATFAAVFLFLYLNLRIARRTLNRPHIVLGTGPDGQPISLEGRQISGLALWVSLAASTLLAWNAAGNWLTWLSFFNAAPFNQADPLFGRDVSFYVFRLPVFQALRTLALSATFLTLVGCGLYYVLSGSFAIDSRYGSGVWPKLRLLPAARRHLSLLAAVIFALMAWGAWLQVPTMLLTPATVIFGVSYADVHARIPFLWAALGVLAAGSVLSIWHGFSRRAWPIPAAVIVYLAVSVVGAVYAGIVQNFSVTPNELDAEQPYIAHNLAATRQAYNLDNVERREVAGDADLRAEDIINNVGTIENVRLWDHDPLRQTFSQIQEIRTYYEFKNVDNDRYMIDGKYRQVMLSARELNIEKMQTRSWLTEHLNYTHGYGLTLGPVNQVTTGGLPVLFVQDLPPVSSKPELKITQPGLYFGEMPSTYAIVRTNRDEFDYPRAGADNATTRYDGSGGVPIGTFLRRLLFAIRFGSTDILFTAQTTAESKIIYHRSIRERVNLVAPFLQLDLDPYPVVSDGRIYWIQDAYTTTANYPYSQPFRTPFGTLNYIRNSVKVVIDAYHGTMTFYLAEPNDPLAVTLARVFPGLVRPLAEMPAGLRQHVRYPEDIFRIQSSVYSTYHMTSPQDFYTKEDQWQAPVLDSGQNPTSMQPYYTIMRLPGEKQTEFIQMLPFTPRAKNNLSAWLAARSDGSHYGQLLLFQFPKQKFISGPQQIAGRINQDQVISPQITLWNQQGSEVLWGTLLVIPVEESLLYVRPLYLRSQAKIPELKKVVVAYQSQSQSQIIMADTLRQALVQIFGQAVAAALPVDRLESSATSVVPLTPDAPDAPTTRPAVVPATQTLEQLVTEAQTQMERALRAQREGDWATYGEAMRKAKDAIDAAAKLKR